MTLRPGPSEPERSLLNVEVRQTKGQYLGDPNPGAYGNDRHGPAGFRQHLDGFMELLRFERLRGLTHSTLPFTATSSIGFSIGH
jgi:hypothetical protein